MTKQKNQNIVMPMVETQEELKPCPLCGRKVEASPGWMHPMGLPSVQDMIDKRPPEYYSITCNNGGDNKHIVVVSAKTEQEAIKIWNNRTGYEAQVRQEFFTHGFCVIDKLTGKDPDIEEIALHEEWAKGLIYCDMEGFAIEDDGTMMLVDECGNFAYCPADRFELRAATGIENTEKMHSVEIHPKTGIEKQK